MRWMMVVFPLVGVLIGALMYGWLWICSRFVAHDALRAVGITLIPIIVTGGLHLDGLADTCDALGANTTPERRREILKDPRSGAFGVIGVVVHLVAYFGIALALEPTADNAWLLSLGFVLSRAMSAYAVLTLKTAQEGTANYFRDSASRGARYVTYAIVVIVVALMYVLAEDKLNLVAPYLASLWCYLYLQFTAKRKFEGMSGDLAGWFLQRCELWQLAALALVQWVTQWK